MNQVNTFKKVYSCGCVDREGLNYIQEINMLQREWQWKHYFDNDTLLL